MSMKMKSVTWACKTVGHKLTVYEDIRTFKMLYKQFLRIELWYYKIWARVVSSYMHPHLQWVWLCVNVRVAVAVSLLYCGDWDKESVFTSLCIARTQAATLTWLAYYDFTCVYVANMQTSLKSSLAFVHSDVKNVYSQSWQPRHGRILCVVVMVASKLF